MSQCLWEMTSHSEERQGECGFRNFCGLLLREMGITGYVEEDTGRIVNPKGKNVNKDKNYSILFQFIKL